MKTSVILAVYNETIYLGDCLSSLIDQKDVDIEVIIVDDGSKLAVKKMNLECLKNPKVKIFSLNHQGPALARNFGVSKAAGEIVVFLDGDMFFEPNFIKTLIQPIVSGVAMGTYSTQEYVANFDNIWAQLWNLENGLTTNLRINNKDNMVRDFRAILKSEFERVKGFDNTGYTDTWSLSVKLNYLPVPTNAIYYHHNPNNLIEIFNQAKWIGGRSRKLGVLGRILALVRASLPISVPVAFYKSLIHKKWQYLPFKLVYDFAIFMGALQSSKKK